MIFSRRQSTRTGRRLEKLEVKTSNLLPVPVVSTSHHQLLPKRAGKMRTIANKYLFQLKNEVIPNQAGNAAAKEKGEGGLFK